MIQVFKNIQYKDHKEHFSLNVELHEDQLVLIILEKNNAWQSEISYNNIDEFAKQFSLSKEEFLSKLKMYFLDTPKNVEFKFTKGEFCCYSKTQNGMNLKYFSTKPRKIQINFNQLLESYSLECEKLRKENENIIKERDEIRKVKENLEEKLSGLVKRKLHDEEQLYSNFILVLNEKKRKIQQLNQLVQAFKGGRPVLNPQVKIKSKTNIKKEIKNEISESDSESTTEEYNTDEDVPANKSNNEDILSNIANKPNCDIFLDNTDSIVSHNLPKRIRTSNTTIDEYENMPSTSKRQEEKKEKVINMEVEEDTSKVTFNTQDLLDCI